MKLDWWDDDGSGSKSGNGGEEGKKSFPVSEFRSMQFQIPNSIELNSRSKEVLIVLILLYYHTSVGQIG